MNLPGIVFRLSSLTITKALIRLDGPSQRDQTLNWFCWALSGGGFTIMIIVTIIIMWKCNFCLLRSKHVTVGWNKLTWWKKTTECLREIAGLKVLLWCCCCDQTKNLGGILQPDSLKLRVSFCPAHLHWPVCVVTLWWVKMPLRVNGVLSCVRCVDSSARQRTPILLQRKCASRLCSH